MSRQAQRNPENTLPLRFLSLALLAHVALLLLPVLREAELPSPPRLEVELLRPAPVRLPPSRPAPAMSEAEPLDSVPTQPQQRRPDAPSAAAGTPPQAAVKAVPGTPAMPSARRIIQSLERLGPEPADMPERLPGRPTHSAAYKAMSRPVMAIKANALDGTFAPARTEIVDRWLAPGGVHQVVVRGPDGNTYCGRQEASDPFRPWTQMPMLFHSCAGGGKR